MPRLASLTLPWLPIERIRRHEGPREDRRALPSPPALPLLASSTPTPQEEEAARLAHCSCPPTPGFRPGARWAAPTREEREAEIARLPLHQRPSVQMLGRRSEPAAPVFRGRGVKPPAPTAQPETPAAPPLVTSRREGQKIVIAAASPEAVALGLARGMTLSHARALCPGLDVRDADPEGDMAFLTRLALRAARRWTPRAGVADDRSLWLDLTGVAHLFGGEERMCRRILALCARLGFTARIAVADTYGAAHALAHHGGRRLTLCPSGGEAAAIAHFPLAALRLDQPVIDAAHRLGIDRVGALIAMPRGPIQRRFGATLLTRLDQALGRAREPFDPIVPEEPASVLLRFLEPIATAEAIEEALGEAMRQLVPRLEEAGLGVRRLAMICDRVDGAAQQAAIGTARATRDGAHLLKLMAARIERIEPGFGLESLRLLAERVEPLASTPIEGALSGERIGGDLAGLVDRLAVRLGERRIHRLAALESDVPERSVTRIGPLERPADWPRWPRPVRLIDPPERIEQVMSALPDGPPRRFRWRGRDYRVAAADGPERIYGEWWRRAGEMTAVRDYFQVEDPDGHRFWLFRRGDGETPGTGDLSWWLQGAFG